MHKGLGFIISTRRMSNPIGLFLFVPAIMKKSVWEWITAGKKALGTIIGFACQLVTLNPYKRPAIYFSIFGWHILPTFYQTSLLFLTALGSLVRNARCLFPQRPAEGNEEEEIERKVLAFMKIVHSTFEFFGFMDIIFSCLPLHGGLPHEPQPER